MNPTAAALLTTALSFVAYGLLAAWHLVPWLRTQGRAAALVPLLWVHAFRHVALELFSAQRAGFAVPDDLRDAIAYGDLVGMALAVFALAALRAGSRFTVPLIWVFVVASVLDLVNALAGGVRAGMMDTAHDVPWLILCFYVPALWVTLGLIVWQLVTRRGEPLHASGGQK
jgi:hypothetical protein